MRTLRTCRTIAWMSLLLLPMAMPAAERMLVEDGQPRAQIVVAADAPRRAGLAAGDLQTYLERISGARLPIVHRPDDAYPVKVYVGQSAHTDALGLDPSDLDYGAFRMVSGDDWLALLGLDEDFEPNEPWARRHNQDGVQTAWEEMTGTHTLSPMRSVYRRWHRRGGEGSLGWSHDRGGSFNAVAAFLHELGVRWYMPGPLGEILPELRSVPLPTIDKTVRPDFPLRYWFGAFFAYEPDDVLWEWRLGMNSGYDVLGAGMHVHGMRLIQGHPRMQKDHPEYYAVIDGKRDTQTRGTGHACFSSEGLAREAAKFARAVFDVYDEPAVSLWPQDGLRRCQCESCAGITTSDLVWGFIDRVAREVYKTHPDRRITGGAYASYRPPPQSIERFSPNVAVFISNVGRPMLEDEESWSSYWSMISEWKAKLGPGRIIRNENNRYSSGRPVPFPTLHPRAMVRDLRALKGVSLGDWNEQARSNFGQPGKTFWNAPGLDHLTLYVNARFLWDAEQDLDALLEEYYRLFYGPAAGAMRTAFEFAESTRDDQQTRRPGQVDLANRVRFVEKVQTAREAAGESVYGERIDLVLSELQPLEDLRRDAAMARARGDAPVYSALLNLSSEKWDAANETFVLDGRIEEPFWHCWNSGGTRLRNAADGKRPEYGARFWTRWLGDALYVGIRCEEDETGPLTATTAADQDPAILEGDHVAILIETSYHSYYQIAVNPAGAILDMDMGAPESDRRRWRSNASVAVHQGEEDWSVELRIPVASVREGAMDPYHYVVGLPPSHVRSRAFPWHFNVGRVRIRDGQRQVSAFSPTGDSPLDDPLAFAQMLMRN